MAVLTLPSSTWVNLQGERQRLTATIATVDPDRANLLSEVSTPSRRQKNPA